MSDVAMSGQAERTEVAWRRRLLVFGESIRSDFGNPLASSWRALLVALTRAGHDITFVEPRRSDSLASLLRHRGARPLRQFSERYPEIQYRTLELPRGRELDLWLARELALVDAVIVLDNALPQVLDLVGRYDEPRLVRIEQLGGGTAASSPPRLPIAAWPVSTDLPSASGHLHLGPAVDTSLAVPPAGISGDRRIAVLAWDAEEQELASRVREQARRSSQDVRSFSLGTIGGEGWRPITELDLASALDGIDLAIVVSDTARHGPESGVRSLLPWSLGVPGVTVSRSESVPEPGFPMPPAPVDELGARLRLPAPVDWPNLIPWSAAEQAASLIAAIDGYRSNYRRPVV